MNSRFLQGTALFLLLIGQGALGQALAQGGAVPGTPVIGSGAASAPASPWAMDNGILVRSGALSSAALALLQRQVVGVLEIYEYPEHSLGSAMVLHVRNMTGTASTASIVFEAYPDQRAVYTRVVAPGAEETWVIPQAFDAAGATFSDERDTQILRVSRAGRHLLYGASWPLGAHETSELVANSNLPRSTLVPAAYGAAGEGAMGELRRRGLDPLEEIQLLRSVDIVALGQADIASLTPSQWRTLAAFVHGGGSLLLAAQSMPTCSGETVFPVKMNNTVAPIGLQTVARGRGAVMWGDSGEWSRLAQGASLQIQGLAAKPDVDYYASLVDDRMVSATLPTRSLFLVLVLFTALAGPVLWLMGARKNRRGAVFFWSPLLALVFSVVGLTWMLLGQGVRPRLSLVAIDELDPDLGLSLRQQRAKCFAPMQPDAVCLPGGARIDVPPYGLQKLELAWLDHVQQASRLIVTRRVCEWRSTVLAASSARLTCWHDAGGQAWVRNDLGRELDGGLVFMAGQIMACGPLASGASAKLQPTGYPGPGKPIAYAGPAVGHPSMGHGAAQPALQRSMMVVFLQFAGEGEFLCVGPDPEPSPVAGATHLAHQCFTHGRISEPLDSTGGAHAR